MVAVELKMQGLFIARQLSFEGATFETIYVEASDDFQTIYNKSVSFVSFDMQRKRNCFNTA